MVALKDITTEQLQLNWLTGLDATEENLRNVLETFNPQIVHVEGLADFPSGDYKTVLEPQIYLTRKGDTSTTIDTGRFVEMLKETDVALLVIGRNDTGRLYENPSSAVAAALAKGYVPAVVAPVRGVDDIAANNFTAELYRSFVQGNSLEVAISEARRRLSSRGGDWSAFALFGSPSSLDFFSTLPVNA